MLIELSLTVVTLLWSYYNCMFIVMTSLLYDAVAISRTDAVDLLINRAMLLGAHIDERSSLGALVALKELI